MSPTLACFQAGNLTYSKCIKCVIVEGKEQCGADQGLLKATRDLGQLRTCYGNEGKEDNGKEDNLSKITAFRKQIKF